MSRKLPTRILASVIVVLMCGTTAGANTLSVNKDTAGLEQVDARLKANVLGRLKLNNGSVKISKNDVSVGAVPDWLFDRHTVLTGKLINHHIDTAGTQTTLSGTMYFLDGDWAKELPDARNRDTIQLANGPAILGRIRNFTSDSFDFDLVTGQTRRYKISEITAIDSPRAFAFSIPLQNVKVDPSNGSMVADADQIGFLGGRARRKAGGLLAYRGPEEPKSRLSGTEGGVPKYYVGTLVGFDMLNTFGPALVAALVLPYSWQSARKEVQRADLGAQSQGTPPTTPFRGDTLRQLQLLQFGGAVSP